MAVELFPMSPRISFSQDLPLTDGCPEDSHQKLDSTLLVLDQDFDFCIEFGREEDSASPADELFADGKILPLSFKKPVSPPPDPPAPAPQQQKSASDCSPPAPRSKESLREILANPESDDSAPTGTKSFWAFSRSSSLDCSSDLKMGSICSLPLISKSNSTGSANSISRGQPLKDSGRQLQNPCRKPPQNPAPSKKKSHFGSHANGVRINPVLNFIPPSISVGSGSLFGFRNFFCNAKDQKAKKRSNNSLAKSSSM